MYLAVLMSLSVALIAAMRRQSWSANWMPLIVAGVALICYTGGSYLDGIQPTLTLDYLRGFVLAVAGQQALHRMVKGTDWYQAIEAAGQPKGLAGQPRVGDPEW